jgi:pimeloyl-ACP methyl ester carboxylesterase
MSTDFSNELEKIQVPALILWGDKDAMCLLKGQQELKEGLSNSQLLVYKDTGHALHWEDGNRFVVDVVAFVSSLE